MQTLGWALGTELQAQQTWRPGCGAEMNHGSCARLADLIAIVPSTIQGRVERAMEDGKEVAVKMGSKQIPHGEQTPKELEVGDGVL